MYSKNDTIVLTGEQANEIQDLISQQQKTIESLRNEVKIKEQKYVDVKWDYNDLSKQVQELQTKIDTYSHEYNKAKEMGDLMTRAYRKEKNKNTQLQDETSFLKSRIDVAHRMYKDINHKRKTVEPKVAKRTYKFEEVYV